MTIRRMLTAALAAWFGLGWSDVGSAQDSVDPARGTTAPSKVSGLVDPDPSAAAAPQADPTEAEKLEGEELEAALVRAGENRAEIEAAMRSAPEEQQPGMRFLIRFMPARDLRSLSAEFLLENVDYAYRARRESPWGNLIPEEVFFNEVLPYANINERRDRWRKDFFDRFRPMIEGIDSPGKVAAVLNQKLFAELNVKYSTQRRRADQGPYESIETGLASCTGLSVLLIDACRAVGVPARFVGTPLWSDKSGNHSWVEVWDQGWHFTGAAEPAGDQLNQAWFIARASQADPDHPQHAIFAVSYKPTPQRFPLVWDRSINDVYAVNVTHRYLQQSETLAEGQMRLMFRILGQASRDRCQADIVLRDKAGQIVYQGQSKDERFDANDHASAVVRTGDVYQLEVRRGDSTVSRQVKADKEGQLVTIKLPLPSEPEPEPQPEASSSAISALQSYLAQAADQREAFDEQAFRDAPLTRADAERARAMLIKDHRELIRATRAEEMEARALKIDEFEMKFEYQVFGEKPEAGRSLFISMHGGGGAPKRVNDRQWRNQIRLYEPEEGVYLAPRAPTDTWNMWHQHYMEPLLGRLIENLIVLEDVDPDRVYIMGYSAGGDGVYQLAPRMADWLAAAAMMAGHPNESQPEGLRNLPFTMHVGGDDSPYQRNHVARAWAKRLQELRSQDPQGYEHWAKIYEGKGHWLDREDAAAVPWMAKFRRNLLPSKVVWRQDDVAHTRFYWLEVWPEDAQAGRQVVASRDGQTITIESSDAPRLVILLSDAMMDLDQPLRVVHKNEELFNGLAQRTIGNAWTTLIERGDPRAMFDAKVSVELPEASDDAAPATSPVGS